MRGSRPCLHDRLFYVKNKYGGAIQDKRDDAYDLLVRWNRATPAVMRFLAGSPLIFRDGDGLAAVHADRVTPRHTLLTAGLHWLVIFRPDEAFGEWDEQP